MSIPGPSLLFVGIILFTSCSSGESYNRFISLADLKGYSEKNGTIALLEVDSVQGSFKSEYLRSFTSRFRSGKLIDANTLVGIWNNQERDPEKAMVIAIGTPWSRTETIITNLFSGATDSRRWAISGTCSVGNGFLVVTAEETFGTIPEEIRTQLEDSANSRVLTIPIVVEEMSGLQLVRLGLGGQLLPIEDMLSGI